MNQQDKSARVALTTRQEGVLKYIRQSIRERGCPPTLRELGTHLGIRSTSGVTDHLRALERKGYLKLAAKGEGRGLTLSKLTDEQHGAESLSEAVSRGFGVPPSPNVAVHAQIMADLRAMTPSEICATSVAAGVHTADGKLTARYEGDKSEPAMLQGAAV